MHREIRDFFVAQSKAQGHGLEARTLARQILDPGNLFDVDQLQRRQPRQRVLEIVDLFGDQLELVGRYVFGQYAALAIEDQAAIRRYRFNADAVALGLLLELLVLHDLQLDQPDHDDAEQQHRENRRDHDAASKNLAF